MGQTTTVTVGDVLSFDVLKIGTVATYAGTRAGGITFAGWIEQHSVGLVVGHYQTAMSRLAIVLFPFGTRLIAKDLPGVGRTRVQSVTNMSTG